MDVLRYRYRLTLDPTSATRLNRVFGACRVVYNDYIALARTAFEAGDRHPSFFTGQRTIVTQGRRDPERPWLMDVPAAVLSASVKRAAGAYESFFASMTGKRKGARVGRPRFKNRRERQSTVFSRNAFTIVGGWENTGRTGGRVRLSGVGFAHVNWHRPLPAAPSSATVIREADGRLWVSFVVERPRPAPTTPTHGPRIAGVDVGLTDFAAVVYSDGSREKIANPRFLRRAERKLHRLQKSLSRTKRGSRNREKARLRLARAHTRVRDQRSNHARQVATRLVRENQAVSVETLNIRGMARTRLSKSIHDAGWAQFLTFLEHATRTRGRTFTKAPALFPSSRVCSLCGTNTGPKPLHVRVWECGACGEILDRDYNAAVNIMLACEAATQSKLSIDNVAAGSAETINACGRDIRRQLAGAVTDEARTHPTPRPRVMGRRKPATRPHSRPGGDRLRTNITHSGNKTPNPGEPRIPTAAGPQKDGPQ